MVIQHNLEAQNANRNLKVVTDSQGKTTEKLSSGYRINRAADDAAGLSISEKLRWQARGLARASTNISEGHDYVQVADAALGEVTDMLHRIRELSVQASNDTNTVSDRLQIDNEIQELKLDIGRIFSDTEFNTRKIWDPNPQDAVIIGYETIPAVDMNNTSTTMTLTNVNKGAIAYGGYQIKVEGTDPEDPSTYGFTVNWEGYNGKEYKSKLISFPDDLSGGFSTTLAENLDLITDPELTGIDFTISWEAQPNVTIEHIKNSIDNIIYHSYVDSSEIVDQPGSQNGISFSFYTDHLAELAADRDAENLDDDYIIPNGGNITPNISAMPSYTDVQEGTGWSIEIDYRNIGHVKATSYSTYFYSSDRDASVENIWWKWIYPSNSSPYKSGLLYQDNSGGGGSLYSITDTVNHPSNTDLSLANNTHGYGGTVEVSFDLTADAPYTYKPSNDFPGKSSSYVGSLTMYVHVSANETEESVMDRIKGVLNSSTVFDMSPSSYFNMSHTVYSPSAHYTPIDEPIYESLNKLHIQSGALNGQDIPITYKSLNLYNVGLKNTNVRTYDAAQKAIQDADDALQIVTEQRSYFGAMENRFDYAKAVNDQTDENTQAAESRIRDTDVAKEMVRHASLNVIAQAGQSVLAQANQEKQNVLQLISG